MRMLLLHYGRSYGESIFLFFFYIFTIINLLVMSLFYYISSYTYILTSLRINIYNIYFQTLCLVGTKGGEQRNKRTC